MNAPLPESAADRAEPVRDSAASLSSALQSADAPNLSQDAAAAAVSSIAAEASGTTWPWFADLPRWLQQELRSDHAGEFGAVMIYHGVLAISRDESARQFAERHLVTEQKHLQLMEEIIPRGHRTRLLPIWRVMGWLTGAIPALFGRQAVFATIEAVETFVDRHYEQQVVRLDPQGELGLLRQTLVDCQADEVSHRDEAAKLAPLTRSLLMRLWCYVVGAGSAAAVVAAKRI